MTVYIKGKIMFLLICYKWNKKKWTLKITLPHFIKQKYILIKDILTASILPSIFMSRLQINVDIFEIVSFK